MRRDVMTSGATLLPRMFRKADSMPMHPDSRSDLAQVRYLGPMEGGFFVTGPETQRSYTFSAHNPVQFVDPKDLGRFELRTDFAIVWRPPSPEAEAALDRAGLAARLATLEAEREEHTRQVARPRPVGRKPFPADQKLLELHLSEHAAHRWTARQIAERLMPDSGFADPPGAMRKRIQRTRKANPAAAEGGSDSCSYCLEGYSPLPPP